MKKFIPVLAAISILALFNSAGATSIDTSMKDATSAVCTTIKSIQGSAFLTLIAMLMFIGGGVMIWLKMRGGLALLLTGFIGYFLIKQSLAIAQAFKLLPAGCSA